MAKRGSYFQKIINNQYLLASSCLFLFLSTPVISSETGYKPKASVQKANKATSQMQRHYKMKNTHLTQSKLTTYKNIYSKYNDLSPEADEKILPLISNALHFQGILYKRGGQSPSTGFDCSGYVQYIFKESFGQTLPRSAAEMAKLGEPIDLHNLQAGDLVFFNTRKRPNSHVGIYLGNQEFIHAPTRGARVRINRLDERYWSSSYELARRYNPDNKRIM